MSMRAMARSSKLGARANHKLKAVQGEVNRRLETVPGISTVRRLATERRPPLTAAEVEFFFAEGYLVKRSLFSSDEVAVINDAVDRCWQDTSIYNPVTISAWTSSSRYTETYVRSVDREARNESYKMNHLYLYDSATLHTIFSNDLARIIAQLIDGTPLLFNGLNMELGTEQRYHFDTFYMPPRSKDKMVVAWIALEDIEPGSGALQYYPKSHLIPPYVFSSGQISAIHSEMPAFDVYIEEQLSERGLQSTRFHPRKGDVFFWHSQLYHGGSRIENPSLTRKSMVTHFWRVEDMPAEMCLKVNEQDFILDPRFMPVATTFVADPAELVNS